MDRLKRLEVLLDISLDIQRFAPPQDELSMLIDEYCDKAEEILQEDELELVTAARKDQHLRTDRNLKK